MFFFNGIDYDIIKMVIRMRIKVVFMGTPEFAVPILEVLEEISDVVLVVSQPDKMVGRKRILTPAPVSKSAEELKIPVFKPSKIRDDYEAIKEVEPDLIVTCAYGQILTKEILDIPRLGAINVHASILPKYRGGAPIHRAIMNGESETGVTIMQMDEGMDSGDIISIVRTSIEESDNVETLHEKLSKLGAEELRRVLPLIIKGEVIREKQKHEEATLAPIIKREDELIDFKRTAREVFNQVRGLNSWPLAYMILDGEEIKVIDGYVGEEAKKEAGVIESVGKDAIGVACQDKIYYITEIKPSGKKKMSVKDYLNGVKKEDLINKKIVF